MTIQNHIFKRNFHKYICFDSEADCEYPLDNLYIVFVLLFVVELSDIEIKVYYIVCVKGCPARQFFKYMIWNGVNCE